jgi:hypothetical protein
MNDIRLTLVQPIIVHGEATEVLQLREPNGEDVAACGFPYELRTQTDNDSLAIKPLADVVLKYGARLASVPPSSMKQLCIADVSALTVQIMGFFGQSA